MDKKVKFNFSVDTETWEKFRYIARSKGKSPLFCFLRILSNYIRNYEKKYGLIDTKKHDK